jgi:hypothetical protein
MMKAFWKLLTKEQQRHLRRAGIRNEKTFWSTRAWQRQQDVDNFEGAMPTCISCRVIERRILGRRA